MYWRRIGEKRRCSYDPVGTPSLCGPSGGQLSICFGETRPSALGRPRLLRLPIALPGTCRSLWGRRTPDVRVYPDPTMSRRSPVDGESRLQTRCSRSAFIDERQLLFRADVGHLRLRESGPLRNPTLDAVDRPGVRLLRRPVESATQSGRRPTGKAATRRAYGLLEAACCENDRATKSTNARTRAAS